MSERTRYRYFYPLALAALLVVGIGCEVNRSNVIDPPGTGGNNGNPSDTTKQGDSTGASIQMTITPTESALLAGQTEQFYASVTGTASTDVTWTVASGPGSVSADGLYTAPSTIDADTVRATVKVTLNAKSDLAATATVVIAKAPTTGENGGGNNGGGDTLLPGQICFEREVLPIFQSSCAMSGCHDAGTAKHGYVFTSYAGIMRGISAGDPDGSDIYEMITGKGKEDDDDDDHEHDDDYDIMPPPPKSPLTSGQIDVIRRWIEQGAKETRCSDNGGGPGGGTGCDTTNVTFSGTVKPILQNNCVGCHSGPTPPRGLNLTSYSGAKVVASNGKLAGAISHAPGFPKMPQGAAKLPDCSIAQIKAWINKGAPNN